ncbi:MAG: 30S ribosomal protein S20 [Eubacteriales bacterium]|nr:30S ribosomal protein S20 [Eubacteriales bacterium]MDD4324077.1 30S ribosomal protein S20 [Eubacteriales bacterium]MDD4541537.1 30S ribosomal protein S20 [Eubacteriales bacterium]
MPNIKSSERRVRSNERKAEYNKRIRSELKTVVKKAISAKEQDLVNQDDLVKQAQQKLDQAVTKGIIHKNTAARRKARIARTQALAE